MTGNLKATASYLLRWSAMPYKRLCHVRSKARQMRDRDRIIRDYLATHKVRKLQLGCGKNLLDGWLNTDIYTTQGPDVAFLDATVRFPFDDGTFDYVFSEHQIEHIPYKHGQFMLQECFRVLKPGGRVRIATPNMAKILALYTDHPDERQQRYIRWSVDRNSKDVGIYSGAHVINTFFTSWGHRFIYDTTTMSQLMASAGFVDIREHPPEKSDDPNLTGIELHAKEIGSVEMNELETMVMEGAKPARS
jgi:predicted SAM-dependent methyltransferase